MPSTGMPSATFSSRPARLGNSCTISRARWRTGAVSSSSRLGASDTRSMGSGSDRWSATENERTSSTSSPKNSTRTGWSAVGGNTSRMPPRTANSPRRATMSTRAYARSTSCTAMAERSCPRPPATSSMGASSARLSASGCSAARTDATTTSGCLAPDFDHSCMRRSAWSRRPTVSALGESRSCGSVSHAGNSSTSASLEVGRERGAQRLALTARGGDREQRGRQPGLGATGEQACEQRRVEPRRRREVGIAQGLSECDVDRGGARKRREQALEVHPTSLRAASDTPARGWHDGLPTAPGCSIRRRLPIRWAPHVNPRRLPA